MRVLLSSFLFFLTIGTFVSGPNQLLADSIRGPVISNATFSLMQFDAQSVERTPQLPIVSLPILMNRPETLESQEGLVWLHRRDFVKSSEILSNKVLLAEVRVLEKDEEVATYITKAPSKIDFNRQNSSLNQTYTLQEPIRQRSFVQKVSEEEFQCMAEAIFFEARGEPLAGKYAVGEVIMNRVHSKQFPNTICGVVKQGGTKRHQCHFSYYCDGLSEKITEPGAFAKIMKISRDVIYEEFSPATNGALFFHSVHVNPSWSKIFTQTTKIGLHKFYAN